MKEFTTTATMLLGGLFLGLSVPFGNNILPFPDYNLFLPLSITLLLFSYIFKFKMTEK